MAETHETIADIIAEKRTLADGLEHEMAKQKECKELMIAHRTAQAIIDSNRREADRLEAAHKLELSKNASKNRADFGQLGDAAKLREALSKFCAYSAVVLNTGMFNRVHLEALLNMAKAALAAPPRNCDRFATADEAFHAWNNTTDTPGGGAYVGLIDWLFTPATEKEGDNDAD